MDVIKIIVQVVIQVRDLCTKISVYNFVILVNSLILVLLNVYYAIKDVKHAFQIIRGIAQAAKKTIFYLRMNAYKYVPQIILLKYNKKYVNLIIVIRNAQNVQVI